MHNNTLIPQEMDLEHLLPQSMVRDGVPQQARIAYRVGVAEDGTHVIIEFSSSLTRMVLDVGEARRLRGMLSKALRGMTQAKRQPAAPPIKEAKDADG